MTLELRNEPVQARSAKRLATIEQAGEVAIAEIGIDRFTTADVARIAGCSIGTVYRYFPDRVAILDRLRPHRHDGAAVLLEVVTRIDMTAVGNEETTSDWSNTSVLELLEYLRAPFTEVS
ncbi:TetR/AcrR family transcriptional regulator [Curtobacterium sp. Curtsp57]|uniref:TetR/AcrR family transcriptional regulator n=1 Tax=Curtobacterium sp. Curtsp57 TaxID=3243047 RepID=UPI0039B4B068